MILKIQQILHQILQKAVFLYSYDKENRRKR